jgi:hypothetical protein
VKPKPRDPDDLLTPEEKARREAQKHLDWAWALQRDAEQFEARLRAQIDPFNTGIYDDD